MQALQFSVNTSQTCFIIIANFFVFLFILYLISKKRKVAKENKIEITRIV